jgi:uncharacterized protein (DUF1697 family)
MDEFRPALEDAGFADVATLVQSGNIVVGHSSIACDVEALVRGVLTSQFKLPVDVVVRDEHALRGIVADNPLRDIADDRRRQFVIFCSEPHEPSRLPTAVAPEVLIPRPRELHAWCPDGAGAGRLMPALGRRPPAPITTFRNWNTVAALAELLGTEG